LTTLLAVDDSTTMRKVIEITFSGEDFETVLASSSNEAMDRLYQASPTVALVDVSLGSDDGYDLCQRIKGERPTTRVLLLSSKQNPFDAGRAAAVGADDHIDKPFDTQAMIDKVRALLTAAPQVAAAAVAPSLQAVAPQPVVAKVATSLEEDIPVLEPESPVIEPEILEDAEELDAVTIEPPGDVAAPKAKSIPVAPPAPRVESAAPAPAPARAPAPAPRIAPAPAARPPAPMPTAAASAPTASVAMPTNGAAAALPERLGQLGLTQDQISGVLALSKEVVEQVVWEVVPTLAEALIKEEIARLTR